MESVTYGMGISGYFGSYHVPITNSELNRHDDFSTSLI